MTTGDWKTINVIDVGQTPKGRPTVKAAGEKDGYLVSNDVKTLPLIGQTIEARISDSVNGGKTYHWLNEWRLSDAQQSAATGNGHAQATPDASLRFISNVVGQAIQAKTITTPEQIKAWAIAANTVIAEILSEP